MDVGTDRVRQTHDPVLTRLLSETESTPLRVPLLLSGCHTVPVPEHRFCHTLVREDLRPKFQRKGLIVEGCVSFIPGSVTARTVDP